MRASAKSKLNTSGSPNFSDFSILNDHTAQKKLFKRRQRLTSLKNWGYS
jgi:hypothetical protein